MFVAADEARAFATLHVVSMCFLRRRTITRCSAPEGDECQRLKFKRMVPRQCSLSPGGRLRCCGAESGCTHAAAKHGYGCGDQRDGVRPGSATDVHARLLRSLSQFDASAVLMELFRGSVACPAVVFSAMSRFGFTQNVRHVNKFGAPRRNRKYQGYEQALGWNRAQRNSLFVDTFMTDNS